MGTKIVERIAINPLAAESESIGLIRISGKCRQQSKELTDEGRFMVRSMDRFLDKQNIDSIRKTMQSQEDIFKHQVRELHRVYSVQKMMLEELKKESRQRRHWSNNHPNLTSTQPTTSYNTSFMMINTKNQTTWRSERSGSCSGGGIDLESPAREISAVDQGRSTRTSRGSDTIEESELELTLSIGSMSNSKSTNNNRDMDSSTTSFRSDNCNTNNNNNNNQDSSGPSTPMSSSSTTLDQEKKRPHWLFQGLSLNPT